MDDVIFRPASHADLPALIAMLADDDFGRQREIAQMPPAPCYEAALAAIAADANQMLAVAEGGGEILGMMQISFIPGLSRQGAWRGLIESVRVARAGRGKGLGHAMFRWAIEECRARGCSLVQLTSDKRREDAHRFYRRLGFVASHDGFKLDLAQ